MSWKTDDYGTAERLSRFERAGMVAALLALVATCALTGVLLAKHFSPAVRPTDEGRSQPTATLLHGSLAIGGIIVSIALYAVVLASNCFIGDLSRPFASRFKMHAYLCQLAVPVPFELGLGILVAIPVYPRLLEARLDQRLAAVLPLIFTFLLLQIPFTWIQLWAPVERSLIRRRLQTLGVPSEEIERGLLIGISNPDQASARRMTMIEDDFGVLWITPDALKFVGDTQRLEITREQPLRIEQKADLYNVAALAGAAHVILRYRALDGGEYRVRLHVEGVPSLSAKARKLDELAVRLRDWRQANAYET